jgi:hypothetical protein
VYFKLLASSFSFLNVFCVPIIPKAVVENAANAETRPQAIEYFKQEWVLSPHMASLGMTLHLQI